MKQSLINTAFRTVLPALMGALGAVVMTLWPVYHTAFCNASILGGS